MRSLVFLDFDGVLNSLYWFANARPLSLLPPVTVNMREQFGFDPAAIRRLNRLVREGSADVVISSGWRENRTLEDLRQLLLQNGFQGRVVGKTPVLSGERTRGHEIATWLQRTGFSGPFVVLDDIDQVDLVRDHFVHVGSARGLLDEHVEKALATLRTDRSPNLHRS